MPRASCPVRRSCSGSQENGLDDPVAGAEAVHQNIEQMPWGVPVFALRGDSVEGNVRTSAYGGGCHLSPLPFERGEAMNGSAIPFEGKATTSYAVLEASGTGWIPASGDPSG